MSLREQRIRDYFNKLRGHVDSKGRELLSELELEIEPLFKRDVAFKLLIDPLHRIREIYEDGGGGRF